ncbi:MAG: hypothetical protein LBH78_00920 [Rickettsiales bacterium]|jgi:hypothetical protein|nr:hypothetical protein [Rickettsiales bacterium]
MFATSWVLKGEIENLKEMVRNSMGQLHELKRQLMNESFSFYWDGDGIFNSSSPTYINSVIEEYEEFYEELENTKDQGSYKKNRELFDKLQEDFKTLRSRSEHFLRSDSKAVRRLGEDFVALGSDMGFEVQVKNANLAEAEVRISELEADVI